ncbi:MAG: hypothetical protein ABSG93_15930 [Solirubrobacteraceae bacterium]
MRSAALLMLSGAALAIGGCGASRGATPQSQRLQRADLVVVSRALTEREPSVRREVAATKAAWPLIAHGLPADPGASSHPAIRAAIERAAALTLPGVLDEHQAAAVTGPGSSIVGVFRVYSLLATRGWQLIGAAIEQVEHGSPAAARFAHANVALYIESVYDAHYSLAQIGKRLLAGYKKLGGAAEFGTSLTQSEVDALAGTYSEANDRLYPHATVRLGS